MGQTFKNKYKVSFIYFILSKMPSNEHLSFFPLRKQLARWIGVTETRVQVRRRQFGKTAILEFASYLEYFRPVGRVVVSWVFFFYHIMFQNNMFLKDVLTIHVYRCVCVYMQVPSEARREGQIPWSLNYTWS